jgi:predicted amidophosphoribosyltransferase
MVMIIIAFIVVVVVGGVLIAPLLWFSHPECPHCKERVDFRATVCPKCTRDIPAKPVLTEARKKEITKRLIVIGVFVAFIIVWSVIK